MLPMRVKSNNMKHWNWIWNKFEFLGPQRAQYSSAKDDLSYYKGHNSNKNIQYVYFYDWNKSVSVMYIQNTFVWSETW